MKLTRKNIGITLLVVLLAYAVVAKYRHIKDADSAAPAEQAQSQPVISSEDPRVMIEKETQPMAVDIIKKMSASWDPKVVQDISHATLLEALKKSDQSWPQYFRIYRKLGKLQGDVKCRKTNVSMLSGNVTYGYADYACDADYKNGHAIITIELAKDASSKGYYLLTVLKIDSPLFIKILEK